MCIQQVRLITAAHLSISLAFNLQTTLTVLRKKKIPKISLPEYLVTYMMQEFPQHSLTDMAVRLYKKKKKPFRSQYVPKCMQLQAVRQK